MKKVVVSLSADSHAMRESLIGVFNYVNEGHEWEVNIVSDLLGSRHGHASREDVEKIISRGVDGVITGFNALTPGFLRLVESGIPCSFIDIPANWKPAKDAPIAILHNDDTAVGKMGAAHLYAKGRFQSFGFICSNEKSFWDTYRHRGFDVELSKHGVTPLTFKPGGPSLEKWITSLDMPTAIMSVSDIQAVNVMETCKRLKIKMPDQITILGVDNDELYCKSVKPQLSSIHPNHRKLGYLAARELNRLMRNQRPRPPIFVPPLRLVERASTRGTPPAGHLIKSTLAYIDSNLREQLSAKAIARQLGVSESLLRLRFRTSHGSTVHACVIKARIRLAKKLLLNTNKSITQIAEETGFSSLHRFSHMWIGKFGQSPSEWRRDCKKTAAPPQKGARQFGGMHERRNRS